MRSALLLLTIVSIVLSLLLRAIGKTSPLIRDIVSFVFSCTLIFFCACNRLLYPLVRRRVFTVAAKFLMRVIALLIRPLRARVSSFFLAWQHLLALLTCMQLSSLSFFVLTVANLHLRDIVPSLVIVLYYLCRAFASLSRNVSIRI